MAQYRNASKTLCFPEGILKDLSRKGLNMGSVHLTYGVLRQLLTYIHDSEERTAFNILMRQTVWSFDKCNVFMDFMRLELLQLNQANSYNIAVLTASIEAAKETAQLKVIADNVLAIELEKAKALKIEKDLFTEFKNQNCLLFKRRIDQLTEIAFSKSDKNVFLASHTNYVGMIYVDNSDLDFSSESDLIMEDYKAMDIERGRVFVAQE